MYIFQRNFLYHPYKNNYLRGEKLNVDFKEISVPSTEGINLKAWFYKNPQNKYTVLFFHGNAGELGNRIYKLNELFLGEDLVVIKEVQLNKAYIAMPEAL
jgi:hypothetical protein